MIMQKVGITIDIAHKPKQNCCHSSREVQRFPPHTIPSHKRVQPQTVCPPQCRGGNMLGLLSLPTWQLQEERKRASRERNTHTPAVMAAIPEGPDKIHNHTIIPV